DFGGCGAVASPLQETFGFAVTASQFESLLLLKSPESVGIEEDFEVLDANHNGRVDRLELRLKTKQDVRRQGSWLWHFYLWEHYLLHK
ncbi:hypothetical protein L914_01558, partial [Phytophthora nicotianae]